jgi:colicin import membrane protein
VSGLLVRSDEAQHRAFRRTLGFSALGHAVLLLLMLLNPSFGRSRSVLPAVVEVSLVAAAPAAAPAAARPAPPRPAPVPAKPPPPKPPPPKPDKVVLPKEAARKPEPKPKPAKPKAAPSSKEPPPDLEDVLAELREESGEEPEPAEVASTAPPSGGIGVPISAEEAAWRRRARAHVRQNWVLEPGFRQQRLETEVEVELGPTGEVLEVEVTRRSGNPWYDESVERAIRKASPLPAPVEPGVQAFVFRPEDIL